MYNFLLINIIIILLLYIYIYIYIECISHNWHIHHTSAGFAYTAQDKLGDPQTSRVRQTGGVQEALVGGHKRVRRRSRSQPGVSAIVSQQLGHVSRRGVGRAVGRY